MRRTGSCSLILSLTRRSSFWFFYFYFRFFAIFSNRALPLFLLWPFPVPDLCSVCLREKPVYSYVHKSRLVLCIQFQDQGCDFRNCTLISFRMVFFFAIISPLLLCCVCEKKTFMSVFFSSREGKCCWFFSREQYWRGFVSVNTSELCTSSHKNREKKFFSFALSRLWNFPFPPSNQSCLVPPYFFSRCTALWECETKQ